jgi:hypothetical protein
MMMGVTARRLGVIAAVLALVAVACGRLNEGDETPPGGDEGIVHPTGADELVLRVEVGGGFVPVEFVLTQIPSFSLYGDGRIITLGPQIEIYPGPALPNLLVTHISEEGVQRILQAARDAGLLGPDRQYDYPGVADAATTTFTLVAEGSTHVTSAYALGESFNDGLLKEDELHGRRALLDFQARLSDLRSWLPEGSVGEETPFEFDELRIFVRPEAPQSEPELEQRPVTWPLPDDLASFGAPVEISPELRCGTVDGDELQQVLDRAAEANTLTPWLSGGKPYSLIFRPLLSDESGCPDTR